MARLSKDFRKLFKAAGSELKRHADGSCSLVFTFVATWRLALWLAVFTFLSKPAIKLLTTIDKVQEAWVQR